MTAPRKYDQETRDRAVRMYRDRRRAGERPSERDPEDGVGVSPKRSSTADFVDRRVGRAGAKGRQGAPLGGGDRSDPMLSGVLLPSRAPLLTSHSDDQPLRDGGQGIATP